MGAGGPQSGDAAGPAEVEGMLVPFCFCDINVRASSYKEKRFAVDDFRGLQFMVSWSYCAVCAEPQTYHGGNMTKEACGQPGSEREGSPTVP